MKLRHELMIGAAIVTIPAAIGNYAANKYHEDSYQETTKNLPGCVAVDAVVSTPNFKRDDLVTAARNKDGSMGNGSCIQNNGEVRESIGGIG